MSDLWLLASHCAALAQIILLLKMNCLKLDQEDCQRMLAVVALVELKDDAQKHGGAPVNHAKEASDDVSSKVISFS